MGAWYLHKHTTEAGDALDAFVVYSSLASLFGNVGQCNYSAANAFMDELVRWRVSRGQAGLSVQWPGVSGVGMAASMDERVAIDSSMSIDVATVKRVVRQLVGFSRLDGEPVQAVLPRGMLEAGVMPREHFGSLLSSVRVKSRAPVSSRGRGDASAKTRRRRTKQSRSSKVDGLDADAMASLVRHEVMVTVQGLLGMDTSRA